jgi:hypothetical protein
MSPLLHYVIIANMFSDHHKLTYFYFAETYVNFNDLVTDLFKQYKVRIWMSAVNPASVVNPAGLQVQPPSAIGPGAIIRSKPANANHAVGPGFGAYPPHQQYSALCPSYPLLPLLILLKAAQLLLLLRMAAMMIATICLPISSPHTLLSSTANSSNGLRLNSMLEIPSNTAAVMLDIRSLAVHTRVPRRAGAL